MTPKTRICLAGALLGGLLLLAAGCGGGGKSANTTTPTTTASSSTTTPSSSGNLGNLASAANCRQLASLGSQLRAAFTGKNQDLQREAMLLQQFADRTPADIRPDFEVFASTFDKIAAALKGMKPGQTPTAAQLAKLATLGTQINQAKLRQADTHIAAWAAKNCKP